MKKLKWLALIVIIVFTVLVAIWLVQDNAAEQELVMFGFSFGHWPFGLWLLMSFFLGTIVSFVIGLPAQVKAQRRVRKLSK